MELYVHLPFCVRKCEYCAFTSFAATSAEEREKYIGALLKEAELRRGETAGPIRTVYLGGGTPSLLSAEQMSRLIGGLMRILPMEEVQEFTAEANPGTVTDEWLAALRARGVNRISFGMQAAQDSLLQTLGRIHRFREVSQSVSLARNNGFDNISLDLIFGIPGQSMQDWKETLEAAVSLQPRHISAYGLIPEEGTPLCKKLQEGTLSLPAPDLEREMYDEALRFLEREGFRQYEISNFARPGFECRHNIGYWDQTPYLGLGVSAASMGAPRAGIKGLSYFRHTNPDTVGAYLKMLDDPGAIHVNDELVMPEEARFETVMLGLRMMAGVSDSKFLSLHGVSIKECYGPVLKRMEIGGLMVNKEGCWRLTRRGMDIQNSILVEFMEDTYADCR